MTDVRTDPLSDDEVSAFRQDGYLFPGKIISDELVDRLREGLDQVTPGKSDGTISYDLMERTRDSAQPVLADAKIVPFHFNLWKSRPEFWEVAFNPVAAGWAAQLLGGDGVNLLADNALIKPPRVGGALHYHQDYPAWPIATPDGATIWIALDDVTTENGSMNFAVGSHLLGERLPVELTTGQSLQRYRAGADSRTEDVDEGVQERSALKPLGTPESEGLPVVSSKLKAGECSMHHTLTWHESGPNETDRPRRAHTVRYVKTGVIFLGEQRASFYYTDEEAAVPIGTPIGGPNFPNIPLDDQRPAVTAS